AQIGAEAIAHRGHVLREPSMRKKSSTLMFRTMAIIAATGGYWAVKAYFFLPIVLVGAAVVSIVGATRRTTRALPRGSRALAPAISEALGRVERVVPGLAARRHRMALRAVVHRALALAEGSPKAATGDELGQAIDAALVAAGRLDALDRELEQVDIRNASDEVRARLHERDVWSARLLEMTASLDAIQARAASARERIAGDAAEARLADLRARIEALEEVAAVTEGSGA
ncbi:MAG: hypothetical protein KC420_18670, partial [Myxococcales bacterium]|nr:hypothetical protein [Myxococcales bacterium]